MGEKLKLSINDLEIWSENPRHIEETENLNLSENDIINILISVVGYRYMYNLAEDIFKNGLMGNTTPVVVHSNNKYLVYDGNRRISCIKILFNPSILDTSNIQLKNLIEKLINEEANSAARFQKLKKIEVYSTTKEEALEIMDKTHSGIQEGVGTIPWDAYQRDKANAKRGIVDYPNAFKLVYKLGLKKKDIKDEYTSYERIFGNSKFKELFKIDNYDEIDNRYLRNIYNLLLRYKREIKNDNGLSRIFNKANEASEEFFEWATPRLFPDDFISIKINIEKMEIYKGQQFDTTKLKISVLDYDGNLLKIDQDLVLANFLSPSNISYNEIDTNQVGTWKYVVSYKNKQACAFIIINELLDPVISLKHPIINLPYGKSIVDLKNEILFATNSINESIVNEINITSNDSIISNFSFLNTNKIGKHNIVYSYIDAYNNKQASECLIINVYKPTQALQTEAIETKILHFDFEEDISKYINNLSYSLKKMIDEINSLTLETHPYVIAASLRSLLYLVYMDYTVKTQGSIKDNLPAQISTLCRALCNDFKDNHIISSKEPWVDETLQNDNFRSLNQKNQWLVDILNCGAHSAGSIISKTQINSAAEKISQIIVYISILIYEE